MHRLPPKIALPSLTMPGAPLLEGHPPQQCLLLQICPLRSSPVLLLSCPVLHSNCMYCCCSALRLPSHVHCCSPTLYCMQELHALLSLCTTLPSHVHCCCPICPAFAVHRHCRCAALPAISLTNHDLPPARLLRTSMPPSAPRPLLHPAL